MVRRNSIEASTRSSMAESELIRGSESPYQADLKFLSDEYYRLVHTTSTLSAKTDSMATRIEKKLDTVLDKVTNTLSQICTQFGIRPIEADISRQTPPVTQSDPYICDDLNRLPMDNRKSLLRKIELPKFDGSNAYDWLSKVERFFRVGHYSDLDKLDLVALSFEGDVLKWFNWEMIRREFQSWEEFRRRLFSRFGAAPEESPGNCRFAIKPKETVSAQVTEQQPVHKEESATHLQVPVSKLEHGLQIHNESPHVYENYQAVVGCDELGKEEIMFSGLSPTSQVWEPGGVLAEHVLVDWLVDCNGYVGTVADIRCLEIGVCYRIKQPIDSRRASRVWERGGLDISTDLGHEKDIMSLKLLLHSGCDEEKLTIHHSLCNTRLQSREMEQFVGFMTFQLKHKWRSKQWMMNQSYVIILGMHWLETLGTCVVDWTKQEWSFIYNGKQVKFVGDTSLHAPPLLIQPFEVQAQPLRLSQEQKLITMAQLLTTETPIPREISAVLDHFASSYHSAITRDLVLLQIQHNLQRAHDIMKHNDDKKCHMVEFAVGDWVYLNLQPSRQLSVVHRNHQKLPAKFFGPFQVVERIGAVAYRLKLPPGSKLPDVFHVFQLIAVLGDHHQVQSSVSPALLEEAVWIPEAVIDIGFDEVGCRELLVKWQDPDASENFWMFSKDFVQLSPSFKLEDKLIFGEGSIDTTLQALYRKKKKKLVARDVDDVAAA